MTTTDNADRISFLPRWVHHAYARVFWYFWTPCPLCGRMFGGHEWRDINGRSSSIPKPGGLSTSGVAICPACTRSGLGRDPELSREDWLRVAADYARVIGYLRSAMDQIDAAARLRDRED